MFETTVVTRHMDQARSRKITLPLTLLLYLTATILISAATVWSVELPARPPAQPQPFASEPILPVPPPSAAPERSEPARTAAEPEVPDMTDETRVERPTDTAPELTPRLVPFDLPIDLSLAPPGGGMAPPDTRTGSDGSGPGVDGGVSGNRIYEPGEASLPKILHSVRPDYPRIALMSHRSGFVILSCVIDAAGTPTRIEVLRSSDPIFESAAKSALAEYRFEPGTVNGNPVRTRFTLTVNFRLDR